MFVAELMGKVPGEVRRLEYVLTSYFFGTMKNLPAETMLIPWLRKAGVQMPLNAETEIHYTFWECLPDGTEPDLIIRLDRQMIMVEVKYLSPLGADKDQLKREIKGGLGMSRKERRDFTYIALTNDCKKPQACVSFCSSWPKIRNYNNQGLLGVAEEQEAR